MLLTSDEEGDAVDGTAAVVAMLRARGETIDACIVGEPTSTERFGDTIKNGRRGSLNGAAASARRSSVTSRTRSAAAIRFTTRRRRIAALVAAEWDRGNEYFQPTSFQISNIHAGTGASNIIPGTLDVWFNFRFSPESTAQALQARVREILDRSRPAVRPRVDADRRAVPDASRSAGRCADCVSGVSRRRAAGAVHEWRDVRWTIPGEAGARSRRVRAAQRARSTRSTNTFASPTSSRCR